MDIYIKTFEQQLIQLINNTNLPAGVVYYILKDITKQVEEIYIQSVNNSNPDEMEPKEGEELSEEVTE